MENKRCSYWFLTINKNAECYNNFENIINDLATEYNYLEYSYIYHNKIEVDDVDDLNHIHCVLYFKNNVRAFTTIQKLFKGSHVELTNKQRYKRCIQYLIHKNDESKNQYLISEIKTNISQTILNEYIYSYGYDYDIFESSRLEEYILDCFSTNKPSIYYFIVRFGLDTIKPYYFIIKDLLANESKNIKDESIQLANEPILTKEGVII